MVKHCGLWMFFFKKHVNQTIAVDPWCFRFSYGYICCSNTIGVWFVALFFERWNCRLRTVKASWLGIEQHKPTWKRGCIWLSRHCMNTPTSGLSKNWTLAEYVLSPYKQETVPIAYFKERQQLAEVSVRFELAVEGRLKLTPFSPCCFSAWLNEPTRAIR